MIGGAIGPLGDLEGSTGAEDAYEVFHEQARLLEGRGVDLFLVETFFDLDELETAIHAVQDVSRRFRSSPSSRSTRTARRSPACHARDAVERLRALGVVAAGANCGLGPQAALAALGEMSAAANGLPLTAQPNVGLPSRSGGRIVYPHATPDYFAEFAAQARSLGAQLIGGCCGTTPAQIAAIRAAVEEGREPRVPLFAIEREVAAEAAASSRAHAPAGAARGRRVGRLRRARPAEGDEHGGDARGRGPAPRLGAPSTWSTSTTTRWRALGSRR